MATIKQTDIIEKLNSFRTQPTFSYNQQSLNILLSDALNRWKRLQVHSDVNKREVTFKWRRPFGEQEANGP